MPPWSLPHDPPDHHVHHHHHHHHHHNYHDGDPGEPRGERVLCWGVDELHLPPRRTPASPLSNGGINRLKGGFYSFIFQSLFCQAVVNFPSKPYSPPSETAQVSPVLSSLILEYQMARIAGHNGSVGKDITQMVLW